MDKQNRNRLRRSPEVNNSRRVTYDARGTSNLSDIGEFNEKSRPMNRLDQSYRAPRRSGNGSSRVMLKSHDTSRTQRRPDNSYAKRQEEMYKNREATRERLAERRRNKGYSESFDEEIVVTGASKSKGFPLIAKIGLAVGIVAVIVALLIFVIIPAINNVGNYEKNTTSSSKVEFTLTNASLSGVPPSKSIESFSLTQNQPNTLTEEEVESIKTSIEAIEDTGAQVGFVVINIKSGYGYSYNSSVKVYGASSIKALYADFMCRKVLTGTDYTLDSYVKAEKILDSSDGYVVGNEYSIRNLLQDMIVKSSNNAFVISRAAFDSYGWDEWVESLGAQELKRDPAYNFAWFSPISAVRVWADLYDFVTTKDQTEVTKTMKDWLGASQLSFIRTALKSTGAGVMSKPGWNSDEDLEWNSTSDSGIVNINGDEYLCSFMTSLPYNDDNKELLISLVKSVFSYSDKLLTTYQNQ